MQSYHRGLCSWRCADASWRSSSPAQGHLPCLPPAVGILNWSQNQFILNVSPVMDCRKHEVLHYTVWQFEYNYRYRFHQPQVPQPESFQRVQWKAGPQWTPEDKRMKFMKPHKRWWYHKPEEKQCLGRHQRWEESDKPGHSDNERWACSSPHFMQWMNIEYSNRV